MFVCQLGVNASQNKQSRYHQIFKDFISLTDKKTTYLHRGRDGTHENKRKKETKKKIPFTQCC